MVLLENNMSAADHEQTRMHWAVICSCDEKQFDVTAATSFFAWFRSELNKEGSDRQSSVLLHNDWCRFVQIKPGNGELTTETYRALHDEHPECAIVFHIFPAKDSPEYGWMKQHAETYGFIRQGLLLENVLNRFAHVNSVQDALRNMFTWFETRLHQLVAGSKQQRAHGVLVRFTNDDQRYTVSNEDVRRENVVVSENFRKLDRDAMYNAVFTSLHGAAAPTHGVNFTHNISGPNKLECCVDIDGCPSNINPFQVAQLFPDFTVVDVGRATVDDMPSSRIRVRFATKFQALHVAKLCESADLTFAERYPLTVQPTSTVLKMQLDKTLKGEY